MPGGTVAPWAGPSHAWWYRVTLGRIRPCLVALCHPWEDQATSGGTRSPQSRPCLVELCHP